MRQGHGSLTGRHGEREGKTVTRSGEEKERMFIYMGNNDYGSENWWMSGALPSRRRLEKERRGGRNERPTVRQIVAGDVSYQRKWHSH